MSLDSKKVAVWHFNNALTATLGGVNGTAIGDATFSDTAKLGSHSAIFDGTGDAVHFGDSFDSIFAGADKKFSFSAWVYLTSNGVLQTITSKFESATLQERQFHFSIDTSNYLYAHFNFAGDVSAYRVVTASTTTLSTGQWYHIVMTYDGSLDTNDGLDRVQMYVNNTVQTRSVTTTTGSLGDMQDFTGRLAVGGIAHASGTSISQSFFGRIDEFNIFNDVLTSAEVSELYNSGTGVELDAEVDADIPANTVTLAGTSDLAVDQVLTIVDNTVTLTGSAVIEHGFFVEVTDNTVSVSGDASYTVGEVVTVPNNTVSLSGDAGYVFDYGATISGRFAPLNARITAVVDKTATMRGKFLPLKARITGLVDKNATMQGRFAPLKARISAVKERNATISAQFTPLKARITALSDKTAELSAQFAPLKCRAYADHETLAANLTYSTVVMNTMNGAHSEYGDDFDGFNSFCFFNGEYYGAKDVGAITGVIKLSSDDPDVEAYFKTGDIDTYKGTESIASVVKREFDIYMSHESDAAMVMEVTGDKELQAYSYPIESERVTIGKGYDSRWFSFKVSNVNGAPFSNFDNVRLLAKQTRRVR